MNTKIIMAIFAICAFFIIIADAGLLVPVTNSIQVTVSPPSGAIYLGDFQRFNDLDFYNYVYKLEFKENTIPAKVWLQFSLDDKKSWSNPGIEIINLKLNETIEQDVNLTNEIDNKSEGFLGDVKYRIVSNPSDPINSELYNGTGPNINVNFRNQAWKKEGDNSYDYQVDVKSSNNSVDIYLYSKKSSDDPWTYYSELGTYANETRAWQTIRWNEAPYFYNVEFVTADELAFHNLR
jgi:hypothetical protein